MRRLLFEPLVQMSVIELKILQDALCDPYYDVEANWIMVLFEEMQEYKPLVACWIVLGEILHKLYSVERWG